MMKAPFVAGQLDFCLNNLDIFTPVLIGFNPAHMARYDKQNDHDDYHPDDDDDYGSGGGDVTMEIR